MSGNKKAFSYVILSFFITIHGVMADEINEIKNNPFKRPSLTQLNKPESSEVTSIASKKTKTKTKISKKKPADLVKGKKIEISAIIFSGKDSMVSVKGKILNIGDVIYDYKLHSVYEGGAVFMRNGKSVDVKVSKK